MRRIATLAYRSFSFSTLAKCSHIARKHTLKKMQRRIECVIKVALEFCIKCIQMEHTVWNMCIYLNMKFTSKSTNVVAFARIKYNKFYYLLLHAALLPPTYEWLIRYRCMELFIYVNCISLGEYVFPLVAKQLCVLCFLTFIWLNIHVADVRAVVCRRKSGSHGADQQATEGKDTGHHRFLHTAVPRVRRACPQTHPHLSKVLQEEQTCAGSELRMGCRKFYSRPTLKLSE